MSTYNRVAPAVTAESPHLRRQLPVDGSGNAVVADASGGATVLGRLAQNAVPPVIQAEASSNLFWLDYI